MILLDTHTLIWMDANDAQLGKRARQHIEAAWQANAVYVSAITFWECAQLVERGRIRLPVPVAQWRLSLLRAGLIERPLDGAIATQSVKLDGLHRDPADRFIAATALSLDAMLITADERLLAWQHDLVRHNARH